MTVKMHCDGPDCEAVVGVTSPGWLTVTQRDDRNTPLPPTNFCGWDCLFARARHPDRDE